MIYIETKNEIIVYEHYMPFDPKYGLGKSEEELKQTGYLVDSIPEYSEDLPEGKSIELHYDGSNFSWALVDKPADPENPTEKIAALEARIAELEAINAAYLGTEE